MTTMPPGTWNTICVGAVGVFCKYIGVLPSFGSPNDGSVLGCEGG